MKLSGTDDLGRMPIFPNSLSEKQAAKAKPDARRLALDEEVAAAKKAAEARIEQFREDAKSAQAQAEARAKEFDVLRKCMLIATRILGGDTVPSEDTQYLLENQPELYLRAVSMRREKDDPEKHKRVTEDEEAQENGASASVAPPEIGGSGDTGGGGSDVDGVEPAAPAAAMDMQT